MRASNKIALALLAAAASAGALRAAPAVDELIGTRIVHWADVKPQPGEGGTVRTFVNAPTSTLLRLGLRARTLEPGATPHPTVPHSRAGEALILVREGSLEVRLDGNKVERLEPGAALFLGPNQWHALRNPGTAPVTYFEIDWTSPGMNGERQF